MGEIGINERLEDLSEREKEKVFCKLTVDVRLNDVDSINVFDWLIVLSIVELDLIGELSVDN